MNYPIYEQCENSLKQALSIIDTLRQRRAINETSINSIRLRRRTADIAMQATFEELRHAFITPIDREDLLRLRQISEAVAYYAEEAMIAYFQHSQPTAHLNDTALLSAVSRECRHLLSAVESFPTYPRSTAILGHLSALERQHRETEAENGSPHGEAAIKNIASACFGAAEAIRCMLLKIS